ncbi:hypothetical protein V8G56_12265 [Gaetbulibacter aquiaggeris]|uniref:Uncharacterized protein n=1 Tax=Gaetbulibacter aquiaggeris TaxID=1735373 RepID=A0ABW7MRP7_9FLAO
MKMKTDTFEIIRDNLTRKYIFYIPEVAHAHLENSIFKGSVPMEICNTIAYFNLNRDLSTNIKVITTLDMLGKEEILKKNQFILFESRTNSDDDYFKVLLNDYMRQLEAHAFVTTWMHRNIEQVFKSIDEKTLTLFKLQAVYFENHYQEVYNHFKIQKHSPSNTNKNIIKALKESLSKSAIELMKPPLFNNAPRNAQTTTTLKKKKSLMSDEDIDRFLLTTVFNIKL